MMGRGGRPAGPILVVTDDLPWREALGQALRLIGRAPILAADAEEALARLGRARLALALLDASLVEAGVERAAEALRARHAGLPLVLVTAGRDVAALAARLGAVTTLRKPFGLAALRGAIEAALGPSPRR